MKLNQNVILHIEIYLNITKYIYYCIQILIQAFVYANVYIWSYLLFCTLRYKDFGVIVVWDSMFELTLLVRKKLCNNWVNQNHTSRYWIAQYCKIPLKFVCGIFHRQLYIEWEMPISFLIIRFDFTSDLIANITFLMG